MASTSTTELLGFLPDVARLLLAVARDDRVPRTTKLATAAALAYVVSPVELVPDAVPVLGRVDDAWVVARALRHLLATAGYDLLRELWTGSDDGFALLLVAAGVHR